MAKHIPPKKPVKNSPVKLNPNEKSNVLRSEISPDIASSGKLKFWLGLIIASFAFILYAQSIAFSYTLDDHPAIDENKITVQGFSAIPILLTTDYWFGYNDKVRGRTYRPTSLIMFAIEWQLFPNNPHVNHFTNVLLYAITCWILFLLLCKFNLPSPFKKVPEMKMLFPFIGTLLYAAHPIHTEVVNNIKSRDEINCFLFGILSIFWVLEFISNKSVLYLITGSLCFLLSVLSKETGITFLVIIPLAVFAFTEATSRNMIKVSLFLISVSVLYFLIRMQALQSVPDNEMNKAVPINNTLYATHDFMSRQATAFYILLRYVLLLIFPHPLTCDYNYATIKIQTLSSPVAMLGILSNFFLGIYALIKIRKKSVVAFAILFYLISLSPVSNVFFLGGSTMAERFMYIPSLGFCVILTYFLLKFTSTISSKALTVKQIFSFNPYLFAAVCVILCLYSIKTISRSMDWKDNLSVFSAAVITSPNSATANKIVGNTLIRTGMLIQDKKHQMDTFKMAIPYIKRALEIYPRLSEEYKMLGYAYFMTNNFDSAYIFYNLGLKFLPGDTDLNHNMVNTLVKLKRYDEAISILARLVVSQPNYDKIYYNLARCYTNKGDYDMALKYFTKVIQLNPKRGDAYYFGGLIYARKGDSENAKIFSSKAKELGYLGQN